MEWTPPPVEESNVVTNATVNLSIRIGRALGWVAMPGVARVCGPRKVKMSIVASGRRRRSEFVTGEPVAGGYPSAARVMAVRSLAGSDACQVCRRCAGVGAIRTAVSTAERRVDQQRVEPIRAGAVAVAA